MSSTSQRLAHVGAAAGKQYLAKCVLNFGKLWIKQQRSGRVCFGSVNIPEVQEGAGQSALSQCGLGVGLGRLAIVVHRPLQCLSVYILPLSHLLLVISRQQHQLVSRGIPGRRLGDRLAGPGQHLPNHRDSDILLDIQ